MNNASLFMLAIVMFLVIGKVWSNVQKAKSDKEWLANPENPDSPNFDKAAHDAKIAAYNALHPK